MNSEEGYIFHSYGKSVYLRDAIVAAHTIRRYDTHRPIALVASAEHLRLLNTWGFGDFFQKTAELPEKHCSITGVKHHLSTFLFFERSLFLDSDMIWCRNPESLWVAFSPFAYTITGQHSADVYFGSYKGFGVLKDIFLRRRQRTLRRFGLTHLNRVQSGMIYISDKLVAQRVEEQARDFLRQKDTTHFVSRKITEDRALESCEWSLAMAMTKQNLHVYPWYNGHESPQMDFLEYMTRFNSDFTSVTVRYYCNPFIHSLRGIANHFLRSLIMTIFSILPRSQDHMWVTPYAIHFGWGHQKEFWNTCAGQLFQSIKKQ